MNRKYIIPIALAKIILAFLVMHIFFSSCESEDLFYEAKLFSEGPLVEIPATFGEGDQVYQEGDTILLDISLEQLTMYDEIGENDIILNSARLLSNFCFINTEGEKVKPSKVIRYSGEVTSLKDNTYQAAFGYISASKNTLLTSAGADLPYLKVGLVFDSPGNYSIYFINTPNYKVNEGEVDIYYNYQDNEAQNAAYAIYYFEGNAKHSHAYNDEIRNDIIKWSFKEEASLDFTISENK